jgi:4-hydroxythreonine-4-phosphate dehydrogenase
MGDPAGIGPEICAKALTNAEIQIAANCLVIGDHKAMRLGLKVAKIPNVEINSIKKVSEAKFHHGTIDVIDLKNVEPSRLKVGQVSKAAG